MSALADAVNALPSISLTELNASAALMSRVDRKYFVPRMLLANLLEAGSGVRALEIDARRCFHYRTVYFDSPDFAFYRQHAQRRRQRFKVRTRTYSDSGSCFLEVKSKGVRGLTVKQRITHNPKQQQKLDTTDRAFATAITRADASRLRPVLETSYRRTTLVRDDQRVTLDVDLNYSLQAHRISGPDDVLVETKGPSRASDLDRMLVAAGVRPHSVSKYCTAAALLYPQLRGNDWLPLLRRHWGANPRPVAS